MRADFFASSCACGEHDFPHACPEKDDAQDERLRVRDASEYSHAIAAMPPARHRSGGAADDPFCVWPLP